MDCCCFLVQLGQFYIQITTFIAIAVKAETSFFFLDAHSNCCLALFQHLDYDFVEDMFEFRANGIGKLVEVTETSLAHQWFLFID